MISVTSWYFLVTELNLFFTSLKHGNTNVEINDNISSASSKRFLQKGILICRVKGTCVPHFSYTYVPLKRASAECLNDLNTHNLTQVNDSVRVTLQLGQ